MLDWLWIQNCRYHQYVPGEGPSASKSMASESNFIQGWVLWSSCDWWFKREDLERRKLIKNILSTTLYIIMWCVYGVWDIEDHPGPMNWLLGLGCILLFLIGFSPYIIYIFVVISPAIYIHFYKYLNILHGPTETFPSITKETLLLLLWVYLLFFW